MIRACICVVLSICFSACYTPTTVHAPISICWITDKRDMCMPIDKAKTLAEAIEQQKAWIKK